MFDPWVGQISWRREWQPTLVFLPEEFHGQKSQVSYSPWDCEELDMLSDYFCVSNYEELTSSQF